MALKRLTKELKDLEKSREKDKEEGYTLNPATSDDLFNWTATIAGPKGSPYEGGVFSLELSIPENYPMDAPEVTFVTKVYHPNISSDGDICLDTLSDQWSPALTLGKVSHLVVSTRKTWSLECYMLEGLLWRAGRRWSES